MVIMASLSSLYCCRTPMELTLFFGTMVVVLSCLRVLLMSVSLPVLETYDDSSYYHHQHENYYNIPTIEIAKTSKTIKYKSLSKKKKKKKKKKEEEKEKETNLKTKETKINQDESLGEGESLLCPEINIGNCSSWYPEKAKIESGIQNRWVFKNSFCHQEDGDNNNNTNNKIYTMSRSEPFEKRTIPELPPPFSFVFFGSSHIRELYLAFIRLHRGISFSSFLEKEVQTVRNGVRPNDLMACDPHRTGYKNGTFGVDLYSCGVPGKRLVPELGDRVAIGFKTFLHTPVADRLFVEFLQNYSHLHLRYPTVILTDVGVWGPRGNRFWKELNYSLTMEEEIDDNFRWLRRTFPTSVLIFMKEHQYYDVGIEPWVNPKMEEFVKNDPRAVLLDKDRLMEDLPPKMKCNHGCAGPVLTVMAHLVLDWLDQALRWPYHNQCLQLSN